VPIGLREGLQYILDHYRDTAPGTPWGEGHPLYNVFSELSLALQATDSISSRPTLKVDFAGRGRQATLPWIAILDTRETRSTQEGVYCVYLFREDLSGVYLTVAVGVTKPRRQFGADTRAYHNYLISQVHDLRPYASPLADAGFLADDAIDLHSSKSPATDYQRATVAYKAYESGLIPEDADLTRDLESVLKTYDQYLQARIAVADPMPEPSIIHPPTSKLNPEQAVQELIEWVAARDYVFEPWQIAAYVAALRTKPFVILAGVTGTGKSSLPRLIAEATGGEAHLVPVRPDWTDSADVLGYSDLQGIFRPGIVLELAKQAMQHPERHWTCVLDEMNLARVEQYFAEVLSRIEDRRQAEGGGYVTQPLLSLAAHDSAWSTVVMPPTSLW